jgi:hypothetical protein
MPKPPNTPGRGKPSDKPRGGPPARLRCGLCLNSGDGELDAVNDAITVINGQAVCDEHMRFVWGEPFASALRAVQAETAEVNPL